MNYRKLYKKICKQKILDFFRKNPGSDALDAARHLGLDVIMVGALCNELIGEGKLVTEMKVVMDKQMLFEDLDSFLIEYGEANWDGEGAKPVSQVAIDVAKQFISQLPPHVPLPETAPHHSGFIVLDWINDRGAISAEITVDEVIYAWVNDPDKHGCGKFPINSAKDFAHFIDILSDLLVK